MNFHNKTIWITGASSGIGEALAYEFDNDGAILILSARRVSELERVKSKCLNPDNISIVALDVTDFEGIPSIVQKALEAHPKIDIFINNSGVSQRSLVKETSIEIDRKIMDINYFGAVNLTKLILPGMLKNGGGHFVATGSVVSKFGFPLRSAYSASKHAMQGFFETLRAESVMDNIKVSIIIAGRIQTNISVNAITKNGTSHGTMDDGQAHGISAIKAAQQIKKGISKEQKEIYVGGKELIMVFIRRFFPSLFYKLASKIKPT